MFCYIYSILRSADRQIYLAILGLFVILISDVAAGTALILALLAVLLKYFTILS